MPFVIKREVSELYLWWPCYWKRKIMTTCRPIPIKYFVSHRPPSREGGSVGRAKKVPEKAGLLSTKAWLRGRFVRNQMV